MLQTTFRTMALEMDTENSPAQQHNTHTPQNVPRNHHNLAFSIERILSDEFGKRTPKIGSLPESNKNSTSPGCGRSTLDNVKNKSEIPIWVFCTRYSARASSGPRRSRAKKDKSLADQDLTDGSESPRSRRVKKSSDKSDKRPRTAFSSEQLNRLRKEFQENRYLTEQRRRDLANDLKLNESQIKIWFQNRRAKLRKIGTRSPLALELMAHGLYNHTTLPVKDDEDDDERPKSCSSS